MFTDSPRATEWNSSTRIGHDVSSIKEKCALDSKLPKPLPMIYKPSPVPSPQFTLTPDVSNLEEWGGMPADFRVPIQPEQYWIRFLERLDKALTASDANESHSAEQ